MEGVWKGVGVCRSVAMKMLFHCFHMTSLGWDLNETFVDCWGGEELLWIGSKST